MGYMWIIRPGRYQHLLGHDLKKEVEIKSKIMSWCQSVDEYTMEQLVALSQMPHTRFSIKLMADCLCEDTEILTDEGFKKITNLSNNNTIANINENNNVFFKKPKNIVIRNLRDNEKMFNFYIKHLNKSIITSEKHRMSYINNMGLIANKIPEITYIKDYKWSGNHLLNNNTINLTDDELRLLIWIIGDGYISKTKNLKSINKRIRFGLVKERKVNRIISILENIGIKYYYLTNDTKQKYISISTKDSIKYLNIISDNKTLPIEFIFNANKQQADVMISEAVMVDGDFENFVKCNTIRLNSTSKDFIDKISAIGSINGYISNCNFRKTVIKNREINSYYCSMIPVERCTASKNGFHNMKIIKKELENYGKKVVCVECDTGFFIARQNGLTFITGNCHAGYGVPIGSVFATKDIIIPYAVGRDSGCGMFATKLSYKHHDLTPELIDKIMSEIVRVIPHGTGVGHRIEQQWNGFDEAPEFPDYIQSALYTARYQLGSLGAGNHFISLLKGDDDHIWIMIHSGSRNLGANICSEFYHQAKDYCTKNKLEVPIPHLSYFPLYSDEGSWYFSMMNFALDFAKENRRRMMTVCESIACGMLGCTVNEEIDIHHNYANLEVHDVGDGNGPEEVLVHRKGATPAFKGQLGIIPGSMGTSSYIVEGLGNEASLCTVSHGAGRAMSRKQAKKMFKKSDTIKLLNGVWYNHIALDEDPRCYKNIHEVINAQNDLVKPIVKLDPLGCIIGT